MKWIDQI